MGKGLIILIIVVLLVGLGTVFYFILDGGDDFDTTNSITVTCEQDNFCVYPEGPGGRNIIKCTDTDGGENLYLRGKIELYDSEGNKYIDKSLERATQQFNPKLNIYEDACLSESELIEYQCNSRDIEDEYTCPKGCKNGACKT